MGYEENNVSHSICVWSLIAKLGLILCENYLARDGDCL